MPFPDDLDPLLRPWLTKHTPTPSDFAQARRRAEYVLKVLQNDPEAGVQDWALDGSVLKGTAIMPLSDLDAVA
ncbi:MAG: hypothetical protein IPO67_25190 [Deltaproteobacteria bacterium]|nr:hypothetical protein [Deltaproteobacteria bacterium]